MSKLADVNMEHVAVMRKSWGLLPKILNGEKKIESRWYKSRCRPWNSIKEGERIYFKDSGSPITLKATVDNILQFHSLDRERVKDILDRYGKLDGIEEKDIPAFFERFKDKNYCIIIYLKNVKKIEPFDIDKSGFGMMSAWLSVDSIEKIRRPVRVKR